MPRPRDGYRQLSAMVREANLDGLEALAARTGRSIAQEVDHALERHLAAPPALTTPPLPAATFTPPAIIKKKRGRPRKKASTE